MPKQNDPQRIPHSRGGTTTRDDATDVGVPMRPAPEGWVHQGPEDALDEGPKRGDYTGRVGDTRHVTTARAYKGPEPEYGEDGQVVAREQNRAVENLVIEDPGGPLDEADPNYERLKAQRERGKR